MTFPNSTCLPASPAARRMVWTNLEPAVSRETSTATRAGPFSTMRIFAGPLTYAVGAACARSRLHIINRIADRGRFRGEHDFAVRDLRGNLFAVGTGHANGSWQAAG